MTGPLCLFPVLETGLEAGDGFEDSFLPGLDWSTSFLFSFPTTVAVAVAVAVAVVAVEEVGTVAVEEIPSFFSITAFGIALGLLCLESRESFVTTGFTPERFGLITTGIKPSTVGEDVLLGTVVLDGSEEPCGLTDFLFLG